MKTSAFIAVLALVCALTLLKTTTLTLGTPTVLEVRLSARLTHIFIVQGDGSVLHWRQTP